MTVLYELGGAPTATAQDARSLTFRAWIMKLANVQVGLLINFNVSVLKEGIKRMVLSTPPSCSR